MHRSRQLIAARLAVRWPGRGRRQRVHFLHVGKTGGTALKAALGPVRHTGHYDLRLHGHAVGLAMIPRGDLFFFCVRDPIERFVSGFCSRQRQGRPRYDVPWSPEEARAFAAFATADALAESLSSPERCRREAAVRAMHSIRHVCDSYSRWFGNPELFASRANDILAIVWLPALSRTFGSLCARLGLELAPELPTDQVVAHRTPAGVERQLKPASLANLRRWYAEDLEFVERCQGHPALLR